MKKKNLIIGIVIAIAIVAIVAVVMLTSNNNREDSNANSENEKNASSVSQDIKAIDNNDNYFITIKGQKFKAGDKISNLSKVDLKQDERVLEEKVKKNTYMIGAGTIKNSNNKTVMNVTPFNPTDDSITVADAVIGGMQIGEYQYDKISEDVLSLDIVICNGLKLGSSLDDVKKVFGEPSSEYEAEKLGYKTYTYKSKETYRSYEFTIDKDGKLSKIRWQNLVYNQ